MQNLSNRVKKIIGTDYVQLHENKDENIKILLCYKNIYNIKTTDECNKIINDYKNYKKEQHDELMKKYEQEKIEQNNIDKINKIFNL